MNKPTLDSILKKPYTELTYDELTLLKVFVNSPTFYQRLDSLSAGYRAELKVAYDKKRRYRESVKEREEREFPALSTYVKEHVKPGDILEFKNTKGSPYRQVVKINASTITSMVVRIARRAKLEITLTGYGSENSIENLVGHFVNVAWVKRKDIIESYKLNNK